MDRAKTGLESDSPIASGVFDTRSGDDAAARAGALAVDLVIAGMDRTRERQKTLDQLAFDVRDCGRRIRGRVGDVIERVLEAPRQGPELLRREARSIEAAIDAANFSEDDPDILALDADGRAAAFMARDELRAGMLAEGVTLENYRQTVNALNEAARALEGC